MELEDYMEPEVGIAIAVTAAVASPAVRSALRRGAVYGLAGLLMAGDAVKTFVEGAARGARQMLPSEDRTTEAGEPLVDIQEATDYTPTGAEAAGASGTAADEAAKSSGRRGSQKAAEATS